MFIKIRKTAYMRILINCLRVFSIIFLAVSLGCSNIQPQSEENASSLTKIQSELASENVSAPIESTEALPSDANTIGEEAAITTDLWQRLRDGYQLDLSIENNRVVQQLKLYSRNQQFLNRIAERGDRYLYFIIEELEKREMPLELALLPVVESAYDPFAYSHGRASGLWQFIPSTGKYYGLKQNWWYDGRRDIQASTTAALDYLQVLANRFGGDWYLALAAYNSGGGTVSRAIQRNKKANLPTDFWSLKLPKETRAYVPKLIADAKLVKAPEDYRVTLTPIANKPFFSVVNIGGQIDLAQAAKLAEVPIKELYQLNPGFNRWATDPDGPHQLLVPTAQKAVFEQALMSLPADQRISWQRYTIRSGDSLIKIAKAHQTTPAVLRSVNNINGNTIRAGKKMLIPIASESSQHYEFSQQQRLAKKQRSWQLSMGQQKHHYRIQNGDSFWKIAKRHGVSVRNLAKWNGMAPGDMLKPGQQLVIFNSTIRVARAGERSPTIKKVGYRVRTGDSLHRIADRFNLSVRDIVRWNTLNKNSYLQPGQALTLFVDVTASH